MRYFSMFSGIGGFELGIGKRGECVGYSEIDKYAIQIYERHFKHKNYGNARNINPKELPEFDMLCGGFPCQSFSIAGKRKGFQDTRGTLFYEICRIVATKRPRLLFLENVKGLLSADNGRCFSTIIISLDELGYSVEWQVLNSKNFGVPQNRERVFIIGHLRGECTKQVFPLRKNNKKLTEEDKRRKTISESNISSTLKAQYYKTPADGTYIRTIFKPKYSKGDGFEMNKRIYSIEGISPTLQSGGSDDIKIISHSPRQGNPTKGGTGTLMSDKHCFTIDRTPHIVALDLYNKKGHTDRTPALTEPHHNSLRMMVGNKIRRLTPTECERLQGFPDGWTEGVSDTQRYKCLGNAVTVNVIEEITKEIMLDIKD